MKSDWVFFVDADERATQELVSEIQMAIQESDVVGWWIPRQNYIFGRLVKYAGWYPDYQLRLLRPNYARYDPDKHVHEVVNLDGPDGYLDNSLIHLNYATVGEFIERQDRYTRYDAGILYQQGQRAHPHNFVLQPLRQFTWRFVTLHGWRDGWHGLLLSALMAYFQFLLYRDLWIMDRKPIQKTPTNPR